MCVCVPLPVYGGGVIEREREEGGVREHACATACRIKSEDNSYLFWSLSLFSHLVLKQGLSFFFLYLCWLL